jgi:hypothetical protein
MTVQIQKVDAVATGPTPIDFGGASQVLIRAFTNNVRLASSIADLQTDYFTIVAGERPISINTSAQRIYLLGDGGTSKVEVLLAIPYGDE